MQFHPALRYSHKPAAHADAVGARSAAASAAAMIRKHCCSSAPESKGEALNRKGAGLHHVGELPQLRGVAACEAVEGTSSAQERSAT